MKRILYILMVLTGLMGFMGCTETVSDAKQETVQPDIYPDYIGVTIPVNIAPLNFNMADETMVNGQWPVSAHRCSHHRPPWK